MPANFAQLATLAEQLATTASRLAKRAAIAEALLATHQQADAGARESPDAGLFALYLAGQPFAESDPRKLNAGGALLTRAVLKATRATNAALTAAYRRHGDLGAAAADLWPDIPSDPSALTLDAIAEAFAVMATARTTAIRTAAVDGLLRSATTLEAKYLLKLMLGDMRIGVKQSLIEEAIAIAASADVAAVRHAVMLEADLAATVTRAFAGTLQAARMRLFHPLGFMLASPVETPEEAVARFTAKPPKPVKPAKKPRRKKSEPAEDFAELSEPDAIAPSNLSSQPEHDGSLVIRSGATCISPAAEATLPIHAFLEDKYDGMRAQLHCGDPAEPGRVALYSRSREDITESFPEICEAFAGITLPPSGAILDGEILGWNYSGGSDGAEAAGSYQALPFSILGQRIGRKRVTDDLRRQVPVVFMAFDLLFADDELLLPLPLRERRARLEALYAHVAPAVTSPLAAPVVSAPPLAQGQLFAASAVPAGELASRSGHRAAEGDSRPRVSRFLLSPSTLVTTAAAIDTAYADARARANEGVMIKAADSAYLPGRRGLAWVKLKRHLDTLDVVITGAEFGSGRRAGLLSDYTFAVRGPQDELLNVGKAYSGVTDAEIAELTAWLQAHTLEDHGHFRTVEPLRVLEVAFNNIMRSDRHSSGFALRFPRILHLRDDKPVDQIDTLDRVEELYQSQPDRPTE